MPRIGKSIETEGRSVAAGAEVECGVTASWAQGFSLGGDELDGHGGCTTLWTYRVPLNCALKNG